LTPVPPPTITKKNLKLGYELGIGEFLLTYKLLSMCLLQVAHKKDKTRAGGAVGGEANTIILGTK
jgi:hypothetical protein